MKISNQSMLNPPSHIPVSQEVDVTLRKTLHNNGPTGPRAVTVSVTVTVPVGCTATPKPYNPEQANLPVSTEVVADEVWTVQCSVTGQKTFQFDNSISLTTSPFDDPDLTNNTATTSWTVTVDD